MEEDGSATAPGRKTWTDWGFSGQEEYHPGRWRGKIYRQQKHPGDFPSHEVTLEFGEMTIETTGSHFIFKARQAYESRQY